MPSLSRLIHIAREQTERCVSKCEFYKTKSGATYRNQAATNYQVWADTWLSILEHLEGRNENHQIAFDLLQEENIRLSNENWKYLERIRELKANQSTDSAVQ